MIDVLLHYKHFYMTDFVCANANKGVKSLLDRSGSKTEGVTLFNVS